MSGNTGIEWTDATWNPVRGCSRVSEGCRRCYAELVASRFSGPGQPFEGFAEFVGKVGGAARSRWTGRVELIPSKLEEPLHWRKPRRIFVNSMSDLFHESLPDEAIAAVFGVMAACPQHTFQVLTKRPERMRAWFAWLRSHRPQFVKEIAAIGGIWPSESERSAEAVLCMYLASPSLDGRKLSPRAWPLPNVWLGVSVEDQATADERIPLLLKTPAALRFVSYEPALGPVDLRGLIQRRCMLGHPFPFLCRRPDHDTRQIDWLIVGGESGPGARPFDLAWARSAIAQCRAAGVPIFVKQLGDSPFDSELQCECFPDDMPLGRHRGCHLEFTNRKGGDPSEWPEDLRVREFPS